MRFDLTTLNLVLAIADTRSITRGAAREHLAVAAASKRLSDLEARLQVTLFERRARGVEPTEAGRALLRHVRSLNASLNALESEVGEFSRGIKGHLRIAANASAIAEHLPSDLAAFARGQPGIRVSLEEDTSAGVQAAVAEGRADVGVFVAPDPVLPPGAGEAALAPVGPAPIDPGLDGRRYRESVLAILVPRGHPMAAAGSQRFDALLDHDIVGLHAGAAAHEQMLRRAQALGRPLNARLQVHGFDAIAQLVEAGLGVAVLPSAVADRFARVFAVQPLVLDEPWARRQVWLAVRRQEVLPPPVRRFVDTLCPPSDAGPAATSPISPTSRKAAP
jgi:DNA-binding transcriptional LysR family regulator